MADAAARFAAVLVQVWRIGAVGDGAVLADCGVSAAVGQRVAGGDRGGGGGGDRVQPVVEPAEPGRLSIDAWGQAAAGALLFVQEYCGVLAGDRAGSGDGSMAGAASRVERKGLKGEIWWT